MIKNFEELKKTSDTCSACLDSKFTGADGKRHVVLCGGTGCLSSHSHEIKEEFENRSEKEGWKSGSPLIRWAASVSVRRDLS